ncbi:hypothetical protein SGPA1_21771 [Streptomyces misionensis JCM 4497]
MPTRPYSWELQHLVSHGAPLYAPPHGAGGQASARALCHRRRRQSAQSGPGTRYGAALVEHPAAAHRERPRRPAVRAHPHRLPPHPAGPGGAQPGPAAGGGVRGDRDGDPGRGRARRRRLPVAHRRHGEPRHPWLAVPAADRGAADRADAPDERVRQHAAGHGRRRPARHGVRARGRGQPAADAAGTPRPRPRRTRAAVRHPRRPPSGGLAKTGADGRPGR